MKKLLTIGLIASGLILGGCFKEEKVVVPVAQKQISENTQSGSVNLSTSELSSSGFTQSEVESALIKYLTILRKNEQIGLEFKPEIKKIEGNYVFGIYTEKDLKTLSEDGGSFLGFRKDGKFEVVGAYAGADIGCSELIQNYGFSEKFIRDAGYGCPGMEENIQTGAVQTGSVEINSGNIQNTSILELENLGEIKDGNSGMNTNVYRNKGLGLQFNSSFTGFILSKNENEITAYQLMNNSKLEDCKEPGCKIIDGKAYREMSGKIKFFNQNYDAGINQVLSTLIGVEGKNPSNCKINIENGDPEKVTLAQKGQISADITLSKEYIPTESEIISSIIKKDIQRDKKTIDCKNTPECALESASMISEKTNSLCSNYAICHGYHCESYFLFEPGITKEKFMYISMPGGEQSFFNWSSVKILK